MAHVYKPGDNLADLHCDTSVPENWKGYGHCEWKVPAFGGWPKTSRRPNG